MHGENEARCPVEQSRLFRDRLLALGRKEGEDFEYVELSDNADDGAEILPRQEMRRPESAA